MEVVKATMEKHNNHLDNSFTSSSRYALSSFGHSFNRSSSSSSSSSSNECLIHFGASYHMAKDKAIFSVVNECNTNDFFVGDDRSLNVLGPRTIHLDNGQV